MIRRIGLLVGHWAAAWLALASIAEATHAITHRYVVLGYVRDAAGRPVSRAEVRVTREKTGLVYREMTGPGGLFVVIVHLHDEDLLDPLEVRAGKMAARIEARFDPSNIRADRGLESTSPATRRWSGRSSSRGPWRST